MAEPGDLMGSGSWIQPNPGPLARAAVEAIGVPWNEVELRIEMSGYRTGNQLSVKPSDGSVVVAAIDGEMSIKRYRQEGNRACLAFENRDLPVFAVEDLQDGLIWGVVRFTIRWHTAKAALKR